ncbi:WecB/TagA/CpsF family glycosyltransferase [Alkalihalobacillus sp. AL-G]|uniref:WecB/TagA/CpsF family glycosyltransferase n=1 Tax=Alkalihalobacillus sp. AL-G TaxID=2926399 RepID=UPI00272D2401|nr:WecB/TagA/CpsF family glycosyltransferase [Alkalihalobacillus sp. AL-G]WLD92991.1 WecB/TagA/CpsF family glycosyltransferase [Alkalihalobacillus sp. AL-G]
MKQEILGVSVSDLTYESLINNIDKDINENKKSFIVAVNPEKIMKAQNSPELKTLLNSATYQIPDGIGVIIASKLKKGTITNRITGIDLMMRICLYASNNKKRIFLYGAKPGVAEEAKERLEETFPGVQIVGTQHGYEADEDKVIEQINNVNPDILFVAMGSPNQENWIIRNMGRLQVNIFQGVGGSFDVICGNTKRAPKSFRNLGLEWLYRLITEPQRFKRQLALPKFLYKILKTS